MPHYFLFVVVIEVIFTLVEMIRTFIAVQLSLEPEYDPMRAELRRRTAYDDIRWSDDAHIHLTLRYIGKTPTNKIDTIKKALDEIAGHTPELDLEIDKLGIFGTAHAPKIFRLSFIKTPQLVQLYTEICQMLEGFEFVLEKQNFVPHITLGRIKKVDNCRRFFALLNELQPEYKQRFHISEIALVRSVLEKGEVFYTTMHISPLGTQLSNNRQ